MKNILIATATLALTVGMASASHDAKSIEQMLRFSKDSAAERIVPETSEGDVLAAKQKFSADKDSVAEQDVLLPEEVNAHSEKAAKEKFAKSKDSAAERNVHYH